MTEDYTLELYVDSLQECREGGCHGVVLRGTRVVDSRYDGNEYVVVVVCGEVSNKAPGVVVNRAVQHGAVVTTMYLSVETPALLNGFAGFEEYAKWVFLLQIELDTVVAVVEAKRVC